MISFQLSISLIEVMDKTVEKNNILYDYWNSVILLKIHLQ